MDASPSQLRVNFIRKLSEMIELLDGYAQFNSSKGSEQRKLVRSMNFWGEYPWKGFDFSIKKKSFIVKSFLILSLPAHLVDAIFYLISRHVLHLCYKNINSVKVPDGQVAFFSPSTNLDEFLSRSTTGFWGDLKYLDPRLKIQSAWFLIPNKPPGISHLEFSRTLRRISKESSFSLFPLAQYFSIEVLTRAIRDVFSFHVLVLRLLIRFFPYDHGDAVLEIFNRNNVGRGIAATALNKSLAAAVLTKFPQLRSVIYLMEGQPWEISLLLETHARDIPVISVLHTPIRKLDTQILNYFITQRGEHPASYIHKVLTPGLDSALQLKHLGLKDEQLGIVEAQRFIPFVSRARQTYSSKSRDVLFVADANFENTIAFIEMITKLDSNWREEFSVYLQLHPSSSHYKSGDFHIWEPKHSKAWGIIIFGPETSAFLQDEFSEANIALFDGRSEFSLSPNSFSLNIPKIQGGSQISELIRNPSMLNVSNTHLLLKDSSFKAWREEIDEIF
jgi:hypothetical protein